MEDISNKTLAILLIAAMVVSLGGTILSLNRLSMYRGVPQQISGFATGTGTANLSILQETTITVVSNRIDFGTGILNVTGGCTNATLLSSSHSPTAGNWSPVYDNCWVSNATTPAAVQFSGEDIVIRNDGNVNVSLRMDSQADSAANFIGGSFMTPVYQFQSVSNETDACDYANNGSWVDINATATMRICSMLKSNNAEDEARVSIKITIPKDATGYKQDNLTFDSQAS